MTTHTARHRFAGRRPIILTRRASSGGGHSPTALSLFSASDHFQLDPGFTAIGSTVLLDPGFDTLVISHNALGGVGFPTVTVDAVPSIAVAAQDMSGGLITAGITYITGLGAGLHAFNVQWPAGPASAEVMITELSTGAFFDKAAANHGVSTTPSVGPTAALVQANEFAVAIIGSNSSLGGQPLPTWGNGFGPSDNARDGTNQGVSDSVIDEGWKTISSAAGVVASATYVFAATWVMCVATFGAP